MTNWSAGSRNAHRIPTTSSPSAWPRPPSEISHWPEYDYVIVNRDIDRALAQIKSILEAERARRTRLIGVGEFVAGLMK